VVIEIDHARAATLSRPRPAPANFPDPAGLRNEVARLRVEGDEVHERLVLFLVPNRSRLADEQRSFRDGDRPFGHHGTVRHWRPRVQKKTPMTPRRSGPPRPRARL